MKQWIMSGAIALIAFLGIFAMIFISVKITSLWFIVYCLVCVSLIVLTFFIHDMFFNN